MAGKEARKYILIPEYAPLYAMAKCYGPTHGPLSKPTLTPVDIIGHLLNQTGRERVSIYEVIKEQNGFSKPVRLTKTNYKLSYQVIAGIHEKEPESGETKVSETILPEKTSTSPVEDPTPFTPEETNETNDLKTESDVTLDDASKVEDEAVSDDHVESEENSTDTTDDIAEIPTEAVHENSVDMVPDSQTSEDANEESSTEEETNESTNPYAGMTKAERKRARREARAKLGENNNI